METGRVLLKVTENPSIGESWVSIESEPAAVQPDIAMLIATYQKQMMDLHEALMVEVLSLPDRIEERFWYNRLWRWMKSILRKR